MFRWGLGLAAIGLACSPAWSTGEPFGQETVEVRPWRNPPQAGERAHRHESGAHRNGGVGHRHEPAAHRHGRAGRHARGHPRSDHRHVHPGGEERFGAAHDHRHGIETEHLFGFTTGSDIDEPGTKHVIVDLSGGFQRRTGSYAALSQHLELAFTPWRDFHVGIGASFAGHRISGVEGLDDRRQVEPEGVALEFRKRFLDRAVAPFGLTLVAESHWSRLDEVSGARANAFHLELTLAADRELIRDRLFAAVNLIYSPEWTRLRETGEMDRESTLGVSLAAMTPLAPSVLVGGELRYLRRYEGAALEAFAGEALYAGPVVFVRVGETVSLIGAYSTQIAGRSAESGGSLDLDHFDRHRAKLKAVVHF